jgi:Protein of unknown function (DUF3617)
MKTLCNALPLLLGLAVISIPAVRAQDTAAQPALSDVPPVTMGLWETQTNSTVTGLENTPMAGMATALGRPHVTQSCLTAERWKSDIQGINARQQRGCTLSNVHQSSSEVSFDQACTTERGGTSNAHVDILIDGAQQAHGSVVMKVENPALPAPMTVTVSMTSHYLSPACGDVKPGEAKMIK